MANMHLRRLIVSAVFLAIALVLRASPATGYIPLFGANGIRVGVHGVFTIMPAILFGPWYGAAVAGLGDVLGHIVRPMDTYLPQMTVIAVAGGFLRGWMWWIIRGRSPINTRIAVAFVAMVLLLFGSYSFARLRIDGVDRHFFAEVNVEYINTSDMGFISRLLIERSQNAEDPTRMLTSRLIEATFAPVVAGVLGLILLGVDMLLSKRLMKRKAFNDMEVKSFFAPWSGSIMPLALTIILISLLINFANTLVLRATLFPGWQLLPFTVIWLPRALSALLVSIVNVYIAAFLLRVCDKQQHIKMLIL